MSTSFDVQGIFHSILHSLAEKERTVIARRIGLDGGKIIKGRKHIYDDTSGNLLDSFVFSANCMRKPQP